MKIFLSALENAQTSKAEKNIPVAKVIVNNNIKMKYNLMSYFYIKNKIELAKYIRDNSELILIDSGAHSFQFGKKVDWDQYTEEYAKFIKNFDKSNVIGYFEMDVDNIIGYDKVLKLREILESVSDKIIPVWHPNRGIEEYKKMCQKYSNKIIAIGGFKGTDIKDEQYIMFLKYAKKYNCKVHCLGMTRTKVLDKIPFDFTDSSSWVQNSIFGRIANKGKISKNYSKNNRGQVFLENYKEGMKMQEHYYRKWKKECKD